MHVYIYRIRQNFRGRKLSQLCTKHHSLENFRGASGPCHYLLYTANDSRVKLSRLAKKPRKFSPSKVLPYTVCQTLEGTIAMLMQQKPNSHQKNRIK